MTTTTGMEIETEKKCSCQCGCTEDATTTDDGDNECCDACADYYTTDDGVTVCSREQSDATCRHCGVEIHWGPIRTGGPGAANQRDGRCSCREWTQTERGPDNWILAEVDELDAA